jgi:hypothetical protein
MLPVLEVLAISNRAARMEWDFRTAASLPPWHLFGLFGPLAFNGPTSGYWPGPPYEWHERLIYVGIVPLLAAGLAAARWRWLCLGAAVIAVAFAFGGYAPWYPLVEWLPGYANLRIPSKHLVLAALALSLAAGGGFDRLHGRRAAVSSLVLAALLVALGLTMRWWVPALAWFGGAELITSEARRALAGPPIGLLWPPVAILILAAGVMTVPLASARVRQTALVALAVLDLVVVLQPFRLRPVDPSEIVESGAVLQQYRRAAFIGGGESTPTSYSPVLANYGPILHVTQPGGYVSLFSGEYMTLLTGRSNAKVEIEVQRDAAPFLSLLGYEAIVERRNGRTMASPLTPTGAWVARCSWHGGALEARARDFPRRSCVARAAAQAREPSVDPGPAQIVAEAPSGLTVEAAGPGWLVIPRPWYPGWSAESSGTPLSVEPVDGALIGVALPAGQQTVSLRYWPAGLTRGLVVSALATLMLLALWWFGRSDHTPGRTKGVRRWLNWASS